MAAKQKITYRATVPATGEVFEFASTREIHFAALIDMPREERTLHSGETWVREGGWGVAKTSKTYEGAAAMGQSKEQSAWFRSMPHVIVPVEIV